jgi:hypothetical protein
MIEAGSDADPACPTDGSRANKPKIRNVFATKFMHSLLLKGLRITRHHWLLLPVAMTRCRSALFDITTVSGPLLWTVLITCWVV